MKLTIKTNPEIVIEIDQEKALPTPTPALDLEPEPEPTVDKAKPEPKQKATGKGKGVRHCKKCGEAGHRSDHCKLEEGSGGTIAERIQLFKEDGMTSDEIADRLGVSISVVNKYW